MLWYVVIGITFLLQGLRIWKTEKPQKIFAQQSVLALTLRCNRLYIGGNIGVRDWVTKNSWPKCAQKHSLEMHKHHPTWPLFLDLALALSSRPGKNSESAEISKVSQQSIGLKGTQDLSNRATSVHFQCLNIRISVTTDFIWLPKHHWTWMCQRYLATRCEHF